MCKVSTLRNVEPICANVFCKAEQLPKIHKVRLITQPLVLIEEDDTGLEFSLPHLKESHPPNTVLGHVEDNVYHKSEPASSVSTKMDHNDKAMLCKRPSTPFITSNLHQKSPTKAKLIQSDASPAIPLPNDNKKVLNRPKLHLSLSYPGASGKSATQSNNLARVPTPPKSPPKNRPVTPFLVSHSRSFDSKKRRSSLHTLDETEINLDCPGKPKSPPLDFGVKESFMEKSIDRDKLEELSEENVPQKITLLPGSQKDKSRKIRMDIAAFTQWIEEHRLP